MRRAALLAGVAALAAALVTAGCGRPAGETPRTVTVYVSEDRVFSEPILADFERETGIRVEAVYDTEEAKSTGVMNRLLAEKDHPRADVYWANEPIRAEVLKQKGVAAPYVSPAAEGIPAELRDPEGYWTGFSARLRVLVVRQGLPSLPASILAYADPAWRGKGVIANPLFGTTTSHVAALFATWGDERARAFLEQVKANGTAISTSNGESADLVASGRYDFALVDSDDAVARMRQGRPVMLVYPDQEEDGLGCFLVPNAVVLVKGAPHPEEGKRLIDYLLSPATEEKLARADCAQLPLHPGVAGPAELRPIEEIRVMKVDWGEVARKMVEIQPLLAEWAGH